jgi:hypothetical protein
MVVVGVPGGTSGVDPDSGAADSGHRWGLTGVIAQVGMEG